MEKEGEGKMTELDHITEQVLKQIDGDGFPAGGSLQSPAGIGISLCMETASILKLREKKTSGNRCLY